MPVDLHAFDFSVRQLQYAVAVAETGAFGKAARRCGVSQPALSAQVARLEEALGVVLFERHSRQVLLTSAGRRVLDAATRVLHAAQDVRSVAQAEADPSGAVLTVGVIPTVAPYLLPEVVARLSALGPFPRVHWVEARTRTCEQRLVEGTLDAAIIADPPSRPGLDASEIGWEPFVALRAGPAPGTPVDAVEVGTLDASTLLLLEEGHCLRDHTLALCGLPGAVESPFRATSLSTLVQMVAAGQGHSVIPASAIAREVDPTRLHVVPFAGDAVGRTLWWLWRPTSAHLEPLEQLRSVLSDAVQAVAPAR